MKVAYYARCDASVESGVLKKLVLQVREWRKAGHDAALFLLSRNTNTWQGASDSVECVMRETGWPSRSLRMAPLMERIVAWKPDVMYVRFDTHAFPLGRAMRRIRTVVELNSDDVEEYRLYLPRYQYLYHMAGRARSLRLAAGFVAVTEEIASRFSEFGKPACVIANGVDLSAFRILPPNQSGPPTLAFIGAPDASWHGLDNLLALARARPDLRVDLIGARPDRGFPSNVTAHGVLQKADYEAVLARADVGVSTLGLYKKNMDEACPLKLREYLAMGLPAVIGYRETDFPEPVPFLLRIPNEPGNARAHAEEIVQFCRLWRGRRVDRSAIGHLDAATKEKRRLDFLEGVALEMPG